MDSGALGLAAVYLLTGVVTTCCNQLVMYQGAAETSTMLIPLVNYFGFALVACLPRAWVEAPSTKKVVIVDGDGDLVKPDTATETLVPHIGPIPLHDNLFFVLMTALDLMGLVAIILGIHFAGSGVFQVIYASVVVWSAIMATFLLDKRMTKKQWCGVVVVVSGLCCSAWGGMDVPGHAGQAAFGCAMSLLAALIFALDYCVAEAKLSVPGAPTAYTVTVRIGVSASVVLLVYFLVVTVPHWTEWVVVPMELAGGNVPTAAAAYLSMMFSQLLHTVVYFKLLGRVGAVATGILNALRAVCVFGASAYMFCDDQQSQCLTPPRVLATFIVCSGVVLYSTGHRAKSERKKATPLNVTRSQPRARAPGSDSPTKERTRPLVAECSP